MLVFQRQEGESFLVGQDIEVRILRVGRGRVKLGVIAPREVGIVRSEISQLNRNAVSDLKDERVAAQMRSLASRLKTSAPVAPAKTPDPG